MDLLTGAPGNQDEKWQLRALGNELDAFSEELQRRPEVRTINKFAVVMAYIRIGLKGIGALMLLWATVVLLGGFVSDLTKKDFWYLTIIAFVQAAGYSQNCFLYKQKQVVQAHPDPRCWEHAISCITTIGNDVENPRGSVEDEPSTLQSHDIQQCGERRLQAELLSLVTTIRANSNLDFVAILMSQTPPAALEDFVVRLKKMVEDNMYATPACLAIQKLTCEMVIGFLQHDQNVKVIDNHNIVGTLMEASETMAGLEGRMLFAGVDRDCHGVPLKPLSSVLAKKAEDLLTWRKGELDIAPTAHAP